MEYSLTYRKSLLRAVRKECHTQGISATMLGELAGLPSSTCHSILSRDDKYATSNLHHATAVLLAAWIKKREVNQAAPSPQLDVHVLRNRIDELRSSMDIPRNTTPSVGGLLDERDLLLRLSHLRDNPPPNTIQKLEAEIEVKDARIVSYELSNKTLKAKVDALTSQTSRNGSEDALRKLCEKLERQRDKLLDML